MSTQSLLQTEYARLTAEHPGAIILIRLGDFFEAFNDHAKTVAKTLVVALTKRGEVPMAGIPAWALDKNVAQLIEAGHRVVTCEWALQKVVGKVLFGDFGPMLGNFENNEVKQPDIKQELAAFKERITSKLDVLENILTAKVAAAKLAENLPLNAKETIAVLAVLDMAFDSVKRSANIGY